MKTASEAIASAVGGNVSAKIDTPPLTQTIEVTPVAASGPTVEASPQRPATPAAVEATDQAKAEAKPLEGSPAKAAPSSILVIDIGGTKCKMLATGHTEPVKFPSGKNLTPTQLVERATKHSKGWDYEAVSIGYPGLVGSQGPRSEPGNLGAGWVGFDFAAAFGKPVKMTNDAAMQALGSYEGGRMLFLGLGTGLGSAMITGHMIIPLELGRLIYDRGYTLGEVLGRQGQRRIGKTRWSKAVNRVVIALMHSFLADYVVIGGGNAKNVKELPPGARRGHNLTAFRGGFRLWSIEDVWVLAAPGEDLPAPAPPEPLRIR